MPEAPNPTDLAGLAAALGIDPAALPAPGGGAGAGPMIRLGTKPAPNIPAGSLMTMGDVPEGVPAGGLNSLQLPEPDLASIDQAKLSILKWTDAELEKFADQLKEAGLLEIDYDREDVERVWEALVDKAARHTMAGRDVTPFDMIDLYAPVQAGKATPAKVVNRQVSLTSNDDARRLLDAALSADLGRRATEREVDDYQAALNDAQRLNPYVSTSITGPDGVATTTTSGGVDASVMADRYGEDRDLDSEYGAYQAATTYFSALMDALQGPVR